MNFNLYFEDMNENIYKSSICEKCNCVVFTQLEEGEKKSLKDEEIFDYEISCNNGEYTEEGLSTFCKCNNKNEFIQVLERKNTSDESKVIENVLWLSKERLNKIECNKCGDINNLSYIMDLTVENSDHSLEVKCSNCNHIEKIIIN